MYASRCGFQLYVKSSSVKPNNSGNAKYKCKILNGQQFFDSDTPFEPMVCPFFMNAYGRNGEWKLTKASLCHNHLLFVGSAQTPLVEGSVSGPTKSKRNTTESADRMTNLINHKLRPANGGAVSNMTGKIVQDFLMSEGCGQVSFAAISRMKASLDDSMRGDLLLTYQKLGSYFKVMADDNPGSLWRIDREAMQSMFMRAYFFPSVGVRAALITKKLIGFDGYHLKSEMHSRGVFLVATANDFNNHILPFGLALVPVENYENWRWFLEAAKEAIGGADRFTILSDRQKGLLSAIADAFPNSGHRFCLRHLMDNITRHACSLTPDERRLICCMARSDFENAFTLFEAELNGVKAAAVKYLKDVDRKHWVKFKYQQEFGLPTYDEITSNLAEQVNNWMTDELRSSKPLNAFSIYFRKLAELMSARRQLAGKWLRIQSEDKLVPVLARLRAEVIETASLCTLTACMDGGYSVQHLGPVSTNGYHHPWRFVNLPDSTCTCGNWQDMPFPCVHAVKAAVADGKPLHELYDADRLSIGHFKRTCSHPFKPYPANISLQVDTTRQLPAIRTTEASLGQRGLNPGSKLKHKRKQSKKKA